MNRQIRNFTNAQCTHTSTEQKEIKKIFSCPKSIMFIADETWLALFLQSYCTASFTQATGKLSKEGSHLRNSVQHVHRHLLTEVDTKSQFGAYVEANTLNVSKER